MIVQTYKNVILKSAFTWVAPLIRFLPLFYIAPKYLKTFFTSSLMGNLNLLGTHVFDTKPIFFL
jgi:hypothetical protein